MTNDNLESRTKVQQIKELKDRLGKEAKEKMSISIFDFYKDVIVGLEGISPISERDRIEYLKAQEPLPLIPDATETFVYNGFDEILQTYVRKNN
jgi:hypothetical protein